MLIGDGVIAKIGDPLVGDDIGRDAVVVDATGQTLLVDGDPTVDITATANIQDIWRRGNRLDRRTITNGR